MTVVDRFSKAIHFLPLPKLPSEMETGELLVQHVFRLHGLDIVSDRGPQFTIQGVWKLLHGTRGHYQPLLQSSPRVQWTGGADESEPGEHSQVHSSPAPALMKVHPTFHMFQVKLFAESPPAQIIDDGEVFLIVWKISPSEEEWSSALAWGPLPRHCTSYQCRTSPGWLHQLPEIGSSPGLI